MIKRLFSSDEISKDLGLLLLRVGVGLSVAVFHGYGKITAGPETWTSIGGKMGMLNVTFYPVFWGFMAGFAEFVCSCLLILGVLFRPAAFLLAFTMMVASMHHVNLPPDQPNAGWSGASHALELMSVYICLLLAGPGKYSFTMRGR